MTESEKAKRYAYTKARRQRLSQEMRAAGIIGAPREKMSDSERKAKRLVYNKDYRKRVFAEAKAYRELMKEGGGAPRRKRR